jgi:hypothetical protein
MPNSSGVSATGLCTGPSVSYGHSVLSGPFFSKALDSDRSVRILNSECFQRPRITAPIVSFEIQSLLQVRPMQNGARELGLPKSSSPTDAMGGGTSWVTLGLRVGAATGVSSAVEAGYRGL